MNESHLRPIYALGEALRLLREELQLTQQQVEQRTSVSITTIGNWERGSCLPREPSLAGYLKALDIPMEDFALLHMRAIARKHQLTGAANFHVLLQDRIKALRDKIGQRSIDFPPEVYRFVVEQLRESETRMPHELSWLTQTEDLIERYVSSSSVSTAKRREEGEKGRHMKRVDAEVEKVLEVLRQKIKDQGLTQQQIQDMFGWGRSYVSQLLTAEKALRFDQIVMILSAIGMDSGEFFAEVYRTGPDEPSGAEEASDPPLPGA